MKVRNHSVLLRQYFVHNYNPTSIEKECDFGLKHYYYVDNN